MICCLSAFRLSYFIFCLDCITFKQQKKQKIMAETSSTDLEVVSMVIWLSTGNGKFFELVRAKTLNDRSHALFFLSAWFS